jgi:hypothetical protein
VRELVIDHDEQFRGIGLELDHDQQLKRDDSVDLGELIHQ